jgi:Toprim domain
MSLDLNLRAIARALGGDVVGRQVVAPGRAHSRRDRSLSVKLSPSAPDGFLVFSHAGDDWRSARDHVRNSLGFKKNSSQRRQQEDGEGARGAHPPQNDNTEFALKLWSAAMPLPGTLGEQYLKKHRGIAIEQIGDLSHALRWSARAHALIALMTDSTTNVATGVHRIFLDEKAAKIERRMLGKQGVVRLTRDEDVSYGLGLSEGIEDGLAVLASGWAPVWAATSANAIARFPVLSGIDALTIFSDADSAGHAAAETCRNVWISEHREAATMPPPLSNGGNK